MIPCSRCSAPTAPLDLCPTSFGNACRACFGLCGVEEVARKEKLAEAIGCAPDEIDAPLIYAHGLLLHEATPTAVAAPEGVAAKLAHDEVSAAHLATFGEPIAPEKARAVAARVRAEPAKASLLVAQAMAVAVDEALVKAKAAQPRVKS